MRIPKKKELIQLQRKYRSDKKIGEVYGVPARLIAYWRGKKKIGPYSYPKYTKDKIVEIWERFGDDTRAGLELGITKAGFRQWRRKYEIDEKPIQLRLEQLELALPDNGRKKNSKRETLIQKIIARKAALKKLDVGQQVEIEPDLVISHGSTASIIEMAEKTKFNKVWDPSRIILSGYCCFNSPSKEFPSLHKKISQFAKTHKLRNFIDPGDGFCDQMLIEDGKILPGQFIVGSEPQISSLGSLGVASHIQKPADIPDIWQTGRVHFQVPDTVKIMFKGHFPKGVSIADLALKMMRDKPAPRIPGKIFEFYGNPILSLSISERMTITSLASSMGAMAALIPIDDVTTRYLKKITKTKYSPLLPDPDAQFNDELEIDINYLTPQVACPDGPDKVRPVEEISSKKIDYVVFGGAINGQIEDLEIASVILRGRRINRELRMFVIPASKKVFLEAIDKGLAKSLIESGCTLMPPGWNPFSAQVFDSLPKGDRILCTVNQNEIRNIARKDLEIYLASPATVAASALEGEIADPREYLK